MIRSLVLVALTLAGATPALANTFTVINIATSGPGSFGQAINPTGQGSSSDRRA
jgi:hypothetical protein